MRSPTHTPLQSRPPGAYFQPWNAGEGIWNASRHSRARRAFTLLEVLLVLAIIGLMTGVFVVGAARLGDDKPSTPDEVFWNAVTASRRQALLSGREVRLSYEPAVTDESSGSPASLTATWDDGQQSFPFEKMGDVVCEFLTTQKGASSILVGGELIETQTIPRVTFYGDGTCTPFRVQFRIGTSAHTLAIDPWTCAQMLESKENAQ